MGKLITHHWVTLFPIEGRDFASAAAAKAGFHKNYRFSVERKALKPSASETVSDVILSKELEASKSDFQEGLWLNLAFGRNASHSGWKHIVVTRADRHNGVIQESNLNLIPFGGRDYGEASRARDSFHSGHRWLAPIEGRWVEVTKDDFEPGIWVRLHWNNAPEGWREAGWCLVMS